MVINKKKWQPCSGIIQNDHIQKQIKQDLGHTHTHTHTPTSTVYTWYLGGGGCAVILTIHVDGLNERRR